MLLFLLHMFYIYFKKTYYHIVMIMNSKLEIGHDIFNNIPSKTNQITPHT